MAYDYWAAGEDAAEAVMEKVGIYYKHLRKRGWLTHYRNLHHQYYAGALEAGIQRDGEQGELAKIQVNDFASLIQRKHVMTSNQKLNLEARAQNTDYKSQARTVVANSYLENCQEEKKLAAHAHDSLEGCLVYGMTDLVLSWNQSIGPPAGQGPNGVIRAGDLEISTHGPLDSIRDPGKTDGRKHSWRVIRNFVNKYDLAARFPDQADAICAIEPDFTDDVCPLMVSQPDEYEGDEIPLYTFLHDKTPSMPDGRFILLCASGVVLADGVLPYQELPVYTLAAQYVKHTPFGYSPSFDLLGLQQAKAGLISIVLTNQQTFGVQNVWLPPGSSIKPSDLVGGLNEITGPQEPKALNLTSTPAEIFNFIESLSAEMQTMFGVNSVARGNPEANLKSGAALALVAAQAVEFNARLQQAFADFMSAVGTGVLQIARDYISIPRMVTISGKSQRATAKEFTGEEFEGLKVYVDLGSAMLRSSAGRLEVANTLLQTIDPSTGMPMAENAQQYLSVLATGKLEPLTENQQAELLYIRAEMEAIVAGEQVEVLITDNDALHILEERTILFDPEARKDAALVERVTMHLQEHIMNMQMKDPALAAAMKHMPPPMPMMPANDPMAAPPGEMAPANEEMDPMGQPKAELPAPAEPPPLPVAS